RHAAGGAAAGHIAGVAARLYGGAAVRAATHGRGAAASNPAARVRPGSEQPALGKPARQLLVRPDGAGEAGRFRAAGNQFWERWCCLLASVTGSPAAGRGGDVVSLADGQHLALAIPTGRHVLLSVLGAGAADADTARAAGRQPPGEANGGSRQLPA